MPSDFKGAVVFLHNARATVYWNEISILILDTIRPISCLSLKTKDECSYDIQKFKYISQKKFLT